LITTQKKIYNQGFLIIFLVKHGEHCK